MSETTFKDCIKQVKKVTNKANRDNAIGGESLSSKRVYVNQMRSEKAMEYFGTKAHSDYLTKTAEQFRKKIDYRDMLSKFYSKVSIQLHEKREEQYDQQRMDKAKRHTMQWLILILSACNVYRFRLHDNFKSFYDSMKPKIIESWRVLAEPANRVSNLSVTLFSSLILLFNAYKSDTLDIFNNIGSILLGGTWKFTSGVIKTVYNSVSQSFSISDALNTMLGDIFGRSKKSYEASAKAMLDNIHSKKTTAQRAINEVKQLTFDQSARKRESMQNYILNSFVSNDSDFLTSYDIENLGMYADNFYYLGKKYSKSDIVDIVKRFSRGAHLSSEEQFVMNKIGQMIYSDDSSNHYESYTDAVGQFDRAHEMVGLHKKELETFSGKRVYGGDTMFPEIARQEAINNYTQTVLNLYNDKGLYPSSSQIERIRKGQLLSANEVSALYDEKRQRERRAHIDFYIKGYYGEKKAEEISERVLQIKQKQILGISKSDFEAGETFANYQTKTIDEAQSDEYQTKRLGFDKLPVTEIMTYTLSVFEELRSLYPSAQLPFDMEEFKKDVADLDSASSGGKNHNWYMQLSNKYFTKFNHLAQTYELLKRIEKEQSHTIGKRDINDTSGLFDNDYEIPERQDFMSFLLEGVFRRSFRYIKDKKKWTYDPTFIVRQLTDTIRYFIGITPNDMEWSNHTSIMDIVKSVQDLIKRNLSIVYSSLKSDIVANMAFQNPPSKELKKLYEKQIDTTKDLEEVIIVGQFDLSLMVDQFSQFDDNEMREVKARQRVMRLKQTLKDNVKTLMELLSYPDGVPIGQK